MDKTTESVVRGKKNGYSSVKLHARRDKKRMEAIARNKAWQKLTMAQQLANLKNRRGESKRQIERINQFNKNR